MGTIGAYSARGGQVLPSGTRHGVEIYRNMPSLPDANGMHGQAYMAAQAVLHGRQKAVGRYERRGIAGWCEIRCSGIHGPKLPRNSNTFSERGGGRGWHPQASRGGGGGSAPFLFDSDSV